MTSLEIIRRCVIAATLAITATATPAGAAEWNKALFDPAPAEGDVDLPLPCGGDLVLRKIVTNPPRGAGDPTVLLEDQSLVMGRPTDAARSYMEGRRQEHIAGPISQNGGERFYYLGKYEISAAQYAAVMAAGPGECPRSGPPGAVPKADVSWYDAVEFTRRLNRWLYEDANGISAIVGLGISDGYVRLPTETEWEFAVRGGLAVGEAERADTRFPMPEGIDAYAWFNAPQSAGGRARAIGTRKPNPLGLHDVYGNLSEIVLDPFRMTRADRLHGLIGGFVARGGSFLDDPVKINSALREEYPFFSREIQGEFRTRFIGFRVAVGTAALGPTIDPTELERASTALRSQHPDSLAPDASERLEAMAAATENQALRAELETLRAQLDQEFARRNDLEAQQLRSTLLYGGMMARELSLTSRALDRFLPLVEPPTATDESIAEFKEPYERNLKLFGQIRRFYTDTVQSLAVLPPERVAREARRLVSDLAASDRESFIPFVQIVQRQVPLYAEGRLTETRQLVREVLNGDRPWN